MFESITRDKLSALQGYCAVSSPKLLVICAIMRRSSFTTQAVRRPLMLSYTVVRETSIDPHYASSFASRKS